MPNPSRNPLVLALSPVFLVVLAGFAGGCEDLESAATGGGGGASRHAVPQVSDLAVSRNEIVGLAVVVTFQTDIAAVGSVEVTPEDGEPFVVEGPSASTTEHRVDVLGLGPERDYAFRALATSGDETAESDDTVPFRTAPLPDWLPAFRVVTSRPDRMEPGLTLFDVFQLDIRVGGIAPDFRPFLVAVDDAGAIVWYLRREDDSVKGMRGYALLPSGNLAFIGMPGLLEIETRGAIVRQLDLESLGLPSLHHDVALLPDGHFAGLTTELRHLVNGSGRPVSAVFDVVWEMDGDGTVVRKWPLADLVPWDVDKLQGSNEWDFVYPGDAPTIDSLHANSVTYDPKEDAFIVGMRNIGMIVKFRRDTGALLWTMGDGGTMGLAGPGGWFGSSHGPELLENGNLLLYDNGPEEINPTNPPSRVIEYAFSKDESGEPVATSVWEWVADAPSPVMGNAQRLPNGNTLFTNGCRILPPLAITPNILEVTPGPDSEVAFELEMTRAADANPARPLLIYRAYRIPDFYGWRR